MNFLDLSFTVNDVIMICGFIAAVLGQWFLLKGRSVANTKAAEEAQQSADEAMQANVTLQNRLSSLEVQMLKDYVPMSRLQELEVRLTQQISDVRNDIGALTRLIIGNKI